MASNAQNIGEQKMLYHYDWDSGTGLYLPPIDGNDDIAIENGVVEDVPEEINSIKSLVNHMVELYTGDTSGKAKRRFFTHKFHQLKMLKKRQDGGYPLSIQQTIIHESAQMWLLGQLCQTGSPYVYPVFLICIFFPLFFLFCQCSLFYFYWVLTTYPVYLWLMFLYFWQVFVKSGPFHNYPFFSE